MDVNFWHLRWKDNRIDFHADSANPLLIQHISKLSLAKRSRVFVPLCGKTVDIAWLMSSGFRVVGAELSEHAIKQLFLALGVEPEILIAGNLTHYCAENIDIFVGDIFNVSHTLLGPVNAIYDRAALVALPNNMRTRYTNHLIEITSAAPQLLISYEYDQSVMNGPPFSITKENICGYYENSYAMEILTSQGVPGGLKGQCEAIENIWLLNRKIKE